MIKYKGMKIAIVAGGTGGHIYPAISLAEELLKKGHELLFIGSNDRMEKDIIPEKGFNFVGLDVFTTRGSIIQKIKSVFSMIQAYFECKKLLQGYDVAIGFGNYISIPVMLAASKLKLKTIIHEQNSFVGRANRFLDKKMDLIIGSYEENLKQFKNKNVKILGNPQTSKALLLEKDESVLSKIGFDKNKNTVVIFMGSLGSSSINKILIEYFKMLDGSYQVVYAAGKNNYQEAISSVKETNYLKIFEHIDGAAFMKNSTLLVSRAGATTICEIEAIGIPAILIPSPYVPNNHQFYNAKVLYDKKAALMIEEKDLSAELLFKTVSDIINNDSKKKEIIANAKKLSNPNVLEDIVKEIENI